MDILIYILLGATSVVGLTFIVERALALRWAKVVPPKITGAGSNGDLMNNAPAPFGP